MKLLSKRPILVTVLVLVGLFTILASAEGQGSVFGNIITYDANNQWVTFTDHTGTWHAPLAIHNSAAPNNSITEFVVNTDDQFEIQTFNQGQLAGFLELDTNGTAALYGGQGGGIGTDSVNGDTCIPTTLTAPCAATSLRIGTNGLVKQYLGQNTAGWGMPTILFTADSTLTGNFGPYTIFTTNASGYASSGMYRLSGYITATNTQLGGSMQFATGYTDEVASQTQVSGQPIPLGIVGANLPFSLVLYSQAGKPITISTITTGGPTYTIHLRLEAM
jgi:hypothetical protein